MVRKYFIIVLCSMFFSWNAFAAVAKDTGIILKTTEPTTTATSGDEEDLLDDVPAVKIDDPLEAYNRKAHAFNRIVDRYLLKPISQVYHKVLPDPVQKSIGNFFYNLDNVPTIANDLLQAKFYQALSDTWRLGVNTTAGIGGLFDVASHIGLERHYEDFGLTLAHWGYKNSSYFVIPFLGPKTIRDTIAYPVDYEFFNVLRRVYPVKVRNSLLITRLISRRAELLDIENVAEEAALDRYVFERNAYLQHRAYLIKENEKSDLPHKK